MKLKRKMGINEEQQEPQNASHVGIRQVIIGPDFTRKEREEIDKLRELKLRRQAGGKWIIRKGKKSKPEEEKKNLLTSIKETNKNLT